MPTEITPPRISSKDMTPSQPIADVEVKTTRGKEAETQRQEQHVEHHPSPSAASRVAGGEFPLDDTSRDFAAGCAGVACIAKNREIDI